jgi:hypothetical protein
MTNLVIAKKSVGVSRREPSIGDNDQASCALSETASSASPNHRLSEHDARWRITQNRAAQEYDNEWDDLCNIIEYRMRLRLRTPSPPRWSLAGDVDPLGKSGFRALTGPLRQVSTHDIDQCVHIMAHQFA